MISSGNPHGLVAGIEGTKGIVEVSCCITSPLATLEEDDDTRETGIRILTRDEE